MIVAERGGVAVKPVSVMDVAKYILQHTGPLSAMKLQKLVYYCQAWSLVWDERPLFAQRIEAWASGPVVPALYDVHRGRFVVGADDITGDPSVLDDDAKETIDSVVSYYGEQTAQWLSDLSHSEAPWVEARGETPDGERSQVEITLASMEEYYGSLGANGQE